MQDILSLLSGFGESLAKRDYAAAVAWCEMPCTMVGPGSRRVYHSHDDAAFELAKLWDAYTAAGVHSMDFNILEERSFSAGLRIVDVEWLLRDASGTVAFVLCSSYVFRNTEPRPMLNAIVSHNALLERPHMAASG